jgi:hypothetical protein
MLAAKAAGLSTPRGRKVLRALMSLDDASAAELRTIFPEGRYGKPRALISGAIERGALPAGADASFLTELLLGPIFHRILVLHLPVDEPFVARVVDHVLRGAAPAAVRPKRTKAR